MKVPKMTAVFAVIVLGLSGCGNSGASGNPASPSATNARAETPEESVRTAIEAHLAHRGNLNLQAFDTDVKQVTIDGDHAQAQVEFRVKNGPGSMELTYQLEKQQGNWTVVDSNPVGSNFSHPPLNQQQTAPAAPAGTSPAINNLLENLRQGSASAPSLPPGHPQ